MGERKAWYLAGDVDLTLTAGSWGRESDRREANADLDNLVASIAEQREEGRKIYFGTATGRTLRSHNKLESENDSFRVAVRHMDLLIGSVGAEMKVAQGSQFVSVEGWPGKVAGWDRKALQKLLQNSSRTLGKLVLQDEISQSDYKLSFNVEGAKRHNEFIGRVQRLLGSNGLKATVIFSGGRYLDLLPRLANNDEIDKGRAVLFGAKLLARRDKVDLRYMQNIFAGDSENDIEGFRRVMQDGGFGVVPGSAQPSFKSWAKRELPRERLYVADAPYAAGVHEGLKHFKILPRAA